MTVGFFDDIYIPASYLPQPTALFVLPFSTCAGCSYPSSDPNERAHFWLPDSDLSSTHELLDTPVSERMYIDQGEVVRVRVEADDFFDDEPGPPKMADGVQVHREAKRAPYNVVVSIVVHPLSNTTLTLTPPLNSVQLQNKVLVLWYGGTEQGKKKRGRRR